MYDPAVIPTLQGERIYLRLLTREDVTPRYVGWLNDPEVNCYLEVRFRTSTLEQVIDEVTAYPRRDIYLFGIFARAADRHLGNVRLGPPNWQHRRAGIGILIGEKSEHGKGLASETLRLVSDFAFAELGLDKLVAGAYEPNQGSIRAFEKAGFSVEAVVPNYWNCDGKRVGEVLLGRDR